MGSCSGAIILGYPQNTFLTRKSKGSHVEFDEFSTFPTPWNQIEGVLAYERGIPTLVIAHMDISGGIFDHGVLGRFIVTADLGNLRWFHEKEVEQYGKKKSLH
jgi:hypothetical protein